MNNCENTNLAVFTDILGDEIGNLQSSQPLSLSSEDSHLGNNVNNSETVRNENNNASSRPAKGTGQYGQFRSVDEIEQKYRDVFSYPFFNLVQSSVIDDALYTDKSMVVSAPTGSGKTVVFEMAIVQLLMELEDKHCNEDFKIIYMAPVKALCTERLTEWYPKFTKLGLTCIVVTGDTNVDFAQLKPYRIIITTPEKWDMVTRRWREHRQLVEVIKLFLIDEVHILNDEARGPVLEAVVSRMKTIESSAQSAHRIEQLQNQYQGTETVVKKSPPKIRFIAVSATVSNPEDVAAWLGNNDKPAVYYKFGDECRPVKLKRVVEGYPCPEGTSIFKFDIILNYKLWPIIQKYHNGKPTLIFCNTRKSVALTAETLSREITISFNPEQKAKLTALASTIKNKKLQSLVLSGVGCHHAGLLYEERVNIEHAFRNRDLPILITTTTLAMGVNLPAHLVIIKNTQQYVNGAYQEYSISTILQMVGRAGRPQFDTEATAVIMTRFCDKPRYQALVGGSEPLQSYLHKRIAENLNSEAALCTVTDVAQCVQWLRSTFLYVRAAKDPRRYLGLPNAAPQQQISKKLEELCVKAMNGLASNGLITMDEASCIESTEAGRLMSIFYLDLETMKHIMKVNGNETLEQLVWIVCESHELADMHLRVDERRCLNTLNRNNAAATIRFPMKGKINSRQMKLNCIIQAVLGCLPIPDPSLNQEAMKIMRIADRICKCLVAYVTRPALISQQPKYYSAVLNAITLEKCVEANLWENSPYVSKQLKGIGPTFSTLLATAGKVNFMILEESHPRDLERIMNKGPPAGNVIRKQISLLPKYQLTMTPIDEKSVSIQLTLLNLNYLAENMEQLTAGENHKSYLIIGDSENNLLLLSSFKDKDLISVYDGSITYQITRKHSFEHKMFAKCISSSYVGIDAHCDYLFKDLDGVVNVPHLNTPNTEFKRPASKQTTITDSYMERKRKNNSDKDITQSKEKKKRDSTLIERFKSLKESFGKTSKELKDDCDKSAVMSNNILKDLTHTQRTVETVKNTTTAIVLENEGNKSEELLPTVTQFNSAAHTNEWDDEILYEDDFIDDNNINNILNDIENEISKRKNALPSQKNPMQSMQRYPVEQSNRDRSSNLSLGNYKLNNQTNKRTHKPVTSNYNFIDAIEKKMDLIEEDNSVPENDSAFSALITDQINKYLEDTKRNSKVPETITELLQSDEHNNSVNPNKDITVQNHQTPKLNANNEEDKHYTDGVAFQHSSYLDLDNMTKRNDSEKNTPTVNKCEQDKSTDAELTEICATTLGDMANYQFDQTNNGDKNYEIENNICSQKQIESSNFDKHNIRNDEDNMLLKKDTKDFSLVLCNSNNLSANSVVPCLEESEEQIESDANDNNALRSSASLYQHSAYLVEPVIKKSKESSVSNTIINDNNAIFITKPGKLQNTKAINRNQNDNIRKYSYSKTKIDVASTSTADAVIQVVRKIKMDLDITEIVCHKKKDKNNREDVETQHAEKYYEQNRTNFEIAAMENDIEKPTNTFRLCHYDSNMEEDNDAINNIKSEKCIEEEAMNTLKALELHDGSVLQQPKMKEEIINFNTTLCDTIHNKPNETLLENNKQMDADQPENKLTHILQKYSKILRKNKSQNADLTPSQNKTSDKVLSQTLLKPKRPFKITNIQNFTAPLPKALIGETCKRETMPQVLSLTERKIDTPPKEENQEDIEHVNNPKRLRTNNNKEFTTSSVLLQEKSMSKSFDIIPECNFPTITIDEIEPTRSEKEYNIDQAMFNPKNLLQRIGKDELDDLIVPPPPEFCDENIPSQLTQNSSIPMDCYDDLIVPPPPEFCDENIPSQLTQNSSIPMDCYEPAQWDIFRHNVHSDDQNIFEHNSQMDSSTDTEIETWTFSENDETFEDFSTSKIFTSPTQPPYPRTHTNSNIRQNNSYKNVSVSRQNKLGQFKFSNKKKLKLL